MVGRDRDLAELVGALDRATGGTPTFAAVTGDPGIGKSRLAAELAAVARARGVSVVVGRCSQDDGAPPLWPWTQVFGALGTPLPVEETSGEALPGAQFRSRDRVVRALLEATATTPLMVVLDDLHWADSASLRVLRLLTESVSDERLLLLGTWRRHPAPTGPLAEAAEALARAHAVRRELTGLPADAVATVVETVAHARPSPAQAAALRTRTDGNPFFLVEYARLAGQRADDLGTLDDLLGDADLPTGVQEVLTRRLEQLPEPTRSALRAASVIGRDFDLPTLAAVTGVDEDELLDLVEPAEVAGLVRENGVDRFRFAHALVRDTLVALTSATRRARMHARVAAALDGVPARATERARHWLAAGPAYAARGWRAAAEAADLAARLYAHEEAAELLGEALVALDQDPEATARERYDLLMQLIDAYRWSASWPELTASVERAVAVAEELGEVELVAEAAMATTRGALWQSAAHGEVHHGIVAALRRSLDRLPAADSPLRCRVMMSLANELYYGAGFAERRALVDEGIAMARRLGDEELLLDVCQIAFVSLWTSGTAPERLALAEEAVGLARRTGSERAFVVSACLRAVALGELGRPAEMWDAVAQARVEAERQRTPYGLMVLDNLVLPWHAMAGRFDRCEELLESIRRLAGQVSLKQSQDATAGAVISLSTWQGRAAETAGVLMALAEGPLPLNATITAYLWRGGQHERARAWHAEHPPQLDTDDWFSLLGWGNAAEAALYVGDPEVGAAAYALLAPLAGRSCVAGSGNASGPVDAYLALAAAASGAREQATRHAEDALALMEAWDIPLAAQWLRDQRETYGF
jgi:hypothetical protein